MPGLQGTLRVRLVAWSSALAVAAVVGVLGARYGLPWVLMMMAGVLLLTVIAALWLSVLSLGGEAPMTLEEAFSLAAPPAEEEQKRAVLRALKDLEYERRMGKITEQDYLELSERYRSEAKLLLSHLESSLGPGRSAAEKLVEERLLGADRKPKRGVPKRRESGETVRPAAQADRVETVSGPSRRCAQCRERSVLEADECWACHVPFAEAGQVLCRACPAAYAESLSECPTCGVSRGEK